jgi:uncharacterized protein with HEPN domain
MWRDGAYLLDMLLAARKVQEFTAGATWESFLASDLLQNAVMRQVQIIGEAARNVSDDFKTEHPDVPWKSIVGMRHRLVHDYFHIVPERVWEVVQHDIAALIAQIAPLVPADRSEEDGRASRDG